MYAGNAMLTSEQLQPFVVISSLPPDPTNGFRSQQHVFVRSWQDAARLSSAMACYKHALAFGSILQQHHFLSDGIRSSNCLQWCASCMHVCMCNKTSRCMQAVCVRKLPPCSLHSSAHDGGELTYATTTPDAYLELIV